MLLRSSALFASAAALGLGGLLLLVACSNKPPLPGTLCKDDGCIAGNKCVDNGTTTECRLLCTHQSECPANFRCTLNPKGDATYCERAQGPAGAITPKSEGQWGYACDPAGGLDQNPDCDADQGFWCYGESPTDGEAFCTQYDCEDDSQCTGGYWCATVNLEPSVRRARRTVGETVRACLPRTYCSPCTSDLDCPNANGLPQYCNEGTDGAKYCTHECQNNGNCRADADCIDGLCTPRAGVCKGDGSLCSPCRSDDDCPEGACVTQAYSREKYCTVKSKIPCRDNGSGLKYECPELPKPEDGSEDPLKDVEVGCQPSGTDPNIPRDHCLGIIRFGRDERMYADGCWTRPSTR